MVFSLGLPVGTSLLRVQGAWGEPGCAKTLPGGIVPLLLVLQQDMAAWSWPLVSSLVRTVGVQVL